MKKLPLIVLATAATFAIPTAANAYTMNSAGVGFVGKGEVQSVFNLNNAAMQKAVDSGTIKFSTKADASQAYSQSAEQAISQTASQSASQSATQSATQTASQIGTVTFTQDVTENLSCITIKGNKIQQSRHGVRSAERSATRTATHTGTRTGERTATRTATRVGDRDGVRTGSRAGILTGNVLTDVSYQDKKTGQWTGWYLKGMSAPAFTTSGAVVWNDPATFGPDQFPADFKFGAYDWSAFDWGSYDFGAYDFGAYDFGTPTFGAPVYGAWDLDGDPNAVPDTCLNSGNGNIIDGTLVHTFTYGAVEQGAVNNGPMVEGAVNDGAVVLGDVNEDAVVEGAVIDGAITYGPAVAGAVSQTSATVLHVTYNGVTKALTPSAI